MMKSIFGIIALAVISASHANAYELDKKALGLMGYDFAIDGIGKYWLTPEFMTDSLDTYQVITLAGEILISTDFKFYTFFRQRP